MRRREALALALHHLPARLAALEKGAAMIVLLVVAVALASLGALAGLTAFLWAVDHQRRHEAAEKPISFDEIRQARRMREIERKP
jgi:hypothetical protein